MRFLPPLIATLFAVAANAGSLDQIDQVDAIELEVSTSRALLLIVLEEDRVHTRPAMKALLKKVNRYLHFFLSGQLKEAAPNADATHHPKIVVYGPREATTGEMQNLAGLRLAGQKVGVDIVVLPHQPGIKLRPVSIKPVKRGGAA